MPALLVSHFLNAARGADLSSLTAPYGIELIVLPQDREARLPEAVVARADFAFFSGDIVSRGFSRQFFSAARKAPNLKWLHVSNAGVDHPIFSEMLARGVRLTTSSGSTAEPIAHTAIAALLMLARGFPKWMQAQREHRWSPVTIEAFPRDLPGQTAVVVGLGHIGKEFSRLAHAFGLTVIGVRRSPMQPGDPVDEMRTPDELAALMPRTDWLVLACPLTPETRGLVNAKLLAALPKTACVINVGRGEVVDEPALIAALESGALAGAYLDVFQQEPLPAQSPLWDLPNVIVTPHNSTAAAGNSQRIYDIFADNLQRWHASKPLRNEVTAPALLPQPAVRPKQ
jgi:phosphoglycerate dehydrogenase-like enzyme